MGLNFLGGRDGRAENQEVRRWQPPKVNKVAQMIGLGVLLVLMGKAESNASDYAYDLEAGKRCVAQGKLSVGQVASNEVTRTVLTVGAQLGKVEFGVGPAIFAEVDEDTNKTAEQLGSAVRLAVGRDPRGKGLQFSGDAFGAVAKSGEDDPTLHGELDLRVGTPFWSDRWTAGIEGTLAGHDSQEYESQASYAFRLWLALEAMPEDIRKEVSARLGVSLGPSFNFNDSDEIGLSARIGAGLRF